MTQGQTSWWSTTETVHQPLLTRSWEAAMTGWVVVFGAILLEIAAAVVTNRAPMSVAAPCLIVPAVFPVAVAVAQWWQVTRGSRRAVQLVAPDRRRNRRPALGGRPDRPVGPHRGRQRAAGVRAVSGGHHGRLPATCRLCGQRAHRGVADHRCAHRWPGAAHPPRADRRVGHPSGRHCRLQPVLPLPGAPTPALQLGRLKPSAPPPALRNGPTPDLPRPPTTPPTTAKSQFLAMC
jgi:hypothetical protein